MSPYGYDYALTPSRSRGWRSGFTSILTVGTIAAISAVSGAVVALDLLGPADSSRLAISHAPPATLRVVGSVTPAAPQTASTRTTASVVVAPPKAAASTPSAAPARPNSAAAIASAPQAAPAAVPAAPTASVEATKVPQAYAQVSERELTFTHGYARRRAVQAAANGASGAKTEVARVVSQSQLGHTAAKAKPKTVARRNAPQDPRRVADAREQGNPFRRFDPPDRFDFGRHQALAYGEPRVTRPAPPPPTRQGFGGFF